MLEDRLPSLIRTIYGPKVLVHASEQARETLRSCGTNPCSFLSQFYCNPSPDKDEVSYFHSGEKLVKQLPTINLVDLHEYEAPLHQRAQAIGERLYKEIATATPKTIPPEIKPIKTRNDIQNFLNTLNFSWFDSAAKVLLFALATDGRRKKISTIYQPHGIALILEVTGKSAREVVSTAMKNVRFELKSMFELNEARIEQLPIAVYILYDKEKGKEFTEAKEISEVLKNEQKMDQNLLFRIEIMKSEADHPPWLSYVMSLIEKPPEMPPKPILKRSAVRGIQQCAIFHRLKITKTIENRINFLVKNYQQKNTAKNKFLTFFRGSTPTENYYVSEEAQLREIADILFMLEDFKRSYETYKELAGKMGSRQLNYTANISQMIQLSLTMCKLYSLKSKVDPNSCLSQKYCSMMIRTFEGSDTGYLQEYMILLMYFIHSHGFFSKDFVQSLILPKLRSLRDSNTNKHLNLIYLVLAQQVANLHLLYPTISKNHYCYDLVRLSNKFSTEKLGPHSIRCLNIVKTMYRGNFPGIEKFISLKISRCLVDESNHKQALTLLKDGWNFLLKQYISGVACQLVEQSQLTSLRENHLKIISEALKTNPKSLQDAADFPINLPVFIDVSIEPKFASRAPSRAQNWSRIGDIFLDEVQLPSLGLQKSLFIKELRLLDCHTPEEREFTFRLTNKRQLAYRTRAESDTTFLKANSRATYLKQPIQVTLRLSNPFNQILDISSIKILTSTAVQFISPPELSLQFLPKQVKTIVFQFLPIQVELLQILGYEWVLYKLPVRFYFNPQNRPKVQKALPGESDEPDFEQDELPAFSTYYTLNVVEECAYLRPILLCQPTFYQGEYGTLILKLSNPADSPISSIYLAFSEESLLKRYSGSLKGVEIPPKSEHTIKLEFKVPAVKDKGIKNLSETSSGSERGLILYKAGDKKFRLGCLYCSFAVKPICWADVRNCERFGGKSYMMKARIFNSQSLVAKAQQNSPKQNSEAILSQLQMCILPDFAIQKCVGSGAEKSLFLRKVTKSSIISDNDNPWAQPTVMKPFMHVLTGSPNPSVYKPALFESQLSETRLSPQNVQLVLYWQIHEAVKAPATVSFDLLSDDSAPKQPQVQRRCGSLLMSPLAITVPLIDSTTRLTYTSLPFSFKASYHRLAEHDFSLNPVKDVQIELRYENIFYEKGLTLIIQLSPPEDSCPSLWQPVTQYSLSLGFECSETIRMSFSVFEHGLYDLATGIKYKVELGRNVESSSDSGRYGGSAQGGVRFSNNESFIVVHREFESLMLEVKKPPSIAPPQSSPANFDDFMSVTDSNGINRF